MAIRAVVFDFGGVLMRTNPAYFEYLQRDYGVTLDDLQRVMRGPTAAENLVRVPRPRAKDLVPIIADGLRPTMGEDAAAAAVAVAEVYHRVEWNLPVPETIHLLQALREAGVPVAILSNGPAEAVEVMLPAILGSAMPEVALMSGTHGVHKPTRAAYEAVALALEVSLAECFFIDDTPMHVDGARDAGMLAFHFQQDVTELESALRAAGVVW